MSLGPKAEKQTAGTSLRAISNSRPATAVSGFIWGGRRGVGRLLPQNQRDPEDGCGEGRVGGLSTQHTFTLGEKKLKGLPTTFSRGLLLPQETAHVRNLRWSFRVEGWVNRCRRGAWRGASTSAEREQGRARGREVFNSPVMPHELQPVFLNLLPLASK